MRYWLMKSEPDEVSFADVLAAPGRTVAWFGVRNYQARNFMRDEMKLGDRVFVYHSSTDEPAIVGSWKTGAAVTALIGRGFHPGTSMDAAGSTMRATRPR